MGNDAPYKLVWIGLIRWRVSIRFRPTWKVWIERTELLLIGVGTEECV
jgi:hypothetical protein